MEKIYYLDNAATTRMFAEDVEILKECVTDFYNPSAAYKQAINVRKKLDNARKTLCNLLGGGNGNIIFTSSATESNNTVFEGVHLRKGQIVLISRAEHPAVFQAAHRLEEKGIIVKDIPLQKDGRVDFEKYKNLIDENVALISVMHVSNETGFINDIKVLCDYAKKINPKILFHSDGVQAFGKIKVNLMDLGIDFYTISAHKVYAPRGVACLWVKNKIVVDPLLVGGGQEFNLRSSTENVFGALAFEKSAKIAINELDKNNANIIQKRQNLINLLQNSAISNYFIINECEKQSPYILSISFSGIKGEVLAHSLEDDGILISTGSACSSKKAGNRTLESMGKNSNDIIGSIRISFSPYEDFDAEYIADSIIKNVLRFENNNIKK